MTVRRSIRKMYTCIWLAFFTFQKLFKIISEFFHILEVIWKIMFWKFFKYKKLFHFLGIVQLGLDKLTVIFSPTLYYFAR